MIEEISKCSNLSTDIYKTASSQSVLEIFLYTKIGQGEYVIKLMADKNCNYLTIEMREICRCALFKIKSKEMEILVLKDITRLRYKNNTESAYFIHNGTIIMTLRLYFTGKQINKKFWIDYYNKALIKNVLQFHQFLEQTFFATQSTYK